MHLYEFYIINLREGKNRMCELLGMSFNKPVKCGFLFRGLTGRSKDNPVDSCSTYYTIKPKRDEIDRLLWGDISRE